MERTVFTAEHEEFRQVMRSFIATEVVPQYAEWERQNQVPRDLFRKLGKLGVMGFDIPEKYGGPGPTSFKFQAVLAEEAARAAVGLGHYSVSTGIVLPYLLRLATPAQKERWLPGVATGETVLCIAMTEPGTGSDLAGIRTTAQRAADGSHYVLNGAKTFITGARNSELCVVVARTSPPGDDRRHGLSLFVVPTDSPGFEIGRRLEKIGLKASDTSELAFTDVVVPAENLLGEADRAFAYLGQNLPRER
ncbi:acyl-CoA dehydrogenase family protein, partial [Streptomyces sp. NPDC055078]